MRSNGTAVVFGAVGGEHVNMRCSNKKGTSNNPTLIRKIEKKILTWRMFTHYLVTMLADTTCLVVRAPMADIDGHNYTGVAYLYTLIPAHLFLQRLNG